MQDRIREAGEDAPQEGVQISVELIEQVRSWAEGVYLMPQFNRFDLAAEIIERCRNQGV
jgi:homocysteine S-methyltransferase